MLATYLERHNSRKTLNLRNPRRTAEEFLDLVGAAALVPGPNSTELAMHQGEDPKLRAHKATRCLPLCR